MAIKSGHGSTLTFGTTSTFTPAFTSLGGINATRESLNSSHLGTTGAMTKVEGDLFELGEQTHTYLFDPAGLSTGESNAIDDLLFDSGNARGSETITETLPGGASIAGTGHTTGFDMEELSTNQLIAASITTTYNDWPTFADET